MCGDVLGDVRRTFIGSFQRRVHDEVVTDAFVDAQGLVPGLSMNSVTTPKFASLCNLGFAPNTDPHNGEVLDRLCELALGLTSVEEDLIENQPDALSHNPSHPISPSGLGAAKFVRDGDRAIGKEVQRATGGRVGWAVGQSTNQIVNSED